MFEMTATSYSAKYVAFSSEKPETGKLSLYKESRIKKQLTIGMYDLAGAVYTVYDSKNKEAASFTTYKGTTGKTRCM